MALFKFFKRGIILLFAGWLLGFALFVTTSLVRVPYDLDQSSDAIVVLTGGKTRIVSGMTLFASGRAPILYISGVHKDVKRSELLSQWTGNMPLPACCIEIGQTAMTTVQNALETESWMRGKHYSSIRLVTGNYHMNRALMEVQHRLPGIEIYPHPLSEPELTLPDRHFWELLLSEYHKTLYRSLQLTFTPRPETFEA